LEVESVVGSGTVFKIELPLIQPVTKDEQTEKDNDKTEK
jgi:hypothetical protein